MNSLNSAIVGLTLGATSLLNAGCSTQNKPANTVHIEPQNSSPYPHATRPHDNSPKDNIREMEAEGWSKLTPQEEIIFKKRGELLKICEQEPAVVECRQQETKVYQQMRDELPDEAKKICHVGTPQENQGCVTKEYIKHVEETQTDDFAKPHRIALALRMACNKKITNCVEEKLAK